MEALSAAELRQFVTDGFVVRRSVLDPDMMAEARTLFWRSAAEDGTGLDAADASTWTGPLPESVERGAAVHGMAENFAKGFIYKERCCGRTALLRRLLPAAVEPVARQLLGDDLLPAGGENAWQLLQGAVDLPALRAAAESSDVGFGPLFSRYLSCIADHQIGDIEYGKESGAADDIGELFVVGSRCRGIYGTLPQPGCGAAGAEGAAAPQHQNTNGLLYDQPPAGHVDVFPFQLGVEAYIDGGPRPAPVPASTHPPKPPPKNPTHTHAP